MPDAYARHLSHLVPLLYLLNHQIGGVTSLDHFESSSCAQCPLYHFVRYHDFAAFGPIMHHRQRSCNPRRWMECKRTIFTSGMMYSVQEFAFVAMNAR